MTCLPNTGAEGSVQVVLAVGAVCVLVGLAVLWRARRSGAGAALLLLVVLAVGGGVAAGVAPAPPAFADCDDDSEPDDSEPDNSLTITQTSVMDDLRPGAEPKLITGVVANNGPDSTFITAIVVSIVGVVQADDAAPGDCDASDYVLLDVRMPVGETLGPDGDATDFEGAAIGFNNKSTNQDACQGATIRLRYRTSS